MAGGRTSPRARRGKERSRERFVSRKMVAGGAAGGGGGLKEETPGITAKELVRDKRERDQQ